LGVRLSLKTSRWSSIGLRHKRGIRPMGEIGVIPPTCIICVREWVIGRFKVIGIDIVDLASRILGKWALDLTIHSQMIN